MASEPSEFLGDLRARPLSQDLPEGLQPVHLFIGSGQSALEVAVIQAGRAPTKAAITQAWRTRRGSRAAPVLLVALTPEGASLCGPVGEEPPIHTGLDRGLVERLCREALAQPDRHAARSFLAEALPSLETLLPGISNAGMLATHELAVGAPTRTDWLGANQKAKAIADRSGNDLLDGLGFSIEPLDNLTQLLRISEKRSALAVLLQDTESIEAGSPRFNNLSPISYALAKAENENLRWVVVLKGKRIRLYSTEQGTGVGRRGRTETYIECQPALLDDDHLAYLWLLFSSDALQDGGTLEELLATSKRFAGDLAARLRDRIYEEVVPNLANGIVAARDLDAPDRADLDLTYQMALTVLFRLLFVAYAEDRDLLPYRQNEAYRRRSLTEKAAELAEAARALQEPGEGDHHWRETAQIWQAVAEGNQEWGVPAYDGGLFNTDPTVSPVGAALAEISVENKFFETALRGLLLTDADGTIGPVDFRSLGVREFGTIYEGLLESELSVAETDLALDRKGAFVPCSENQPAEVTAGEVYLHNRSGARKSSGSYYTKDFAVEHLLDGALEPALDDHLARLDEIDDADAADALFDFRVADIAMGSGHFLVSAIDHIEARFANYLEARPLPGVQAELARLRAAAQSALGDLAAEAEIEDGQLLRRQIARRCVYGVDLNDLAVQLARLSIWIHTFVPGLPLSLLDHNLVRGNSLVGVGTIDEIRKKFQETGGTLFEVDADSLLGEAEKPLRRLANLNDATLADIAEGRQAMQEAEEAIGTTRALCDLITAQPITENQQVLGFPYEEWERLRHGIENMPEVGLARQELEGLEPLHFPIAFPEVFLGAMSGFNIIIGNPPWKSPIIHEVAFWARHSPGLRGLSQTDAARRREELTEERPDLLEALMAEEVVEARMRRALMNGMYPGMGSGDPDVYKAFCWRFWHLIRAEGGRLGVVLPRSAMNAKGSEDFRKELFTKAADVRLTMLLNNRQWAFDELHPQWTIALSQINRGTPPCRNIFLKGPYRDLNQFEREKNNPPIGVTPKEVADWNDSFALPLLPSEKSIGVFRQLRKAPRLDFDDGLSWRARPYGEAHSKKCKEFLLSAGENAESAWPVFKGESFNLDVCDTGEVYGYTKPETMGAWLESARRRQIANSAYSEFPREWALNQETAPWHQIRVAYRDVARATDTRTIIATVVPPGLFLTDTAPYFLFPRGSVADQIFLYGILRSRPFDWYARRYIENHVKFYMINSFPVPRPKNDSPLRQRLLELAGRLACPDRRFAEWAGAVGVEFGALPEDEKQNMIQELDAVAAHLYGLGEEQLIHIFETFHEGWDYEDHLSAVLVHFRAWSQSL